MNPIFHFKLFKSMVIVASTRFDLGLSMKHRQAMAHKNDQENQTVKLF